MGQGDFSKVIAIIVGTRFRRLRVDRGITQLEVARRAGSHGPIVARFEKGRFPARLDTIEKFAAAIGLRASDVVSAVDSPVAWSAAETVVESKRFSGNDAREDKEESEWDRRR